MTWRNRTTTAEGGGVTRKAYARGLIVLLSAVCLASVASAQTSWWRTYGGPNSEGGTPPYRLLMAATSSQAIPTPSVQGMEMSISSRPMPKATRSGPRPMADGIPMGAAPSNRRLMAVTSSEASPIPSVQGALMSISSRPMRQGIHSGPGPTAGRMAMGATSSDRILTVVTS